MESENNSLINKLMFTWRHKTGLFYSLKKYELEKWENEG